jgi:polyferredoxin
MMYADNRNPIGSTRRTPLAAILLLVAIAFGAYCPVSRAQIEYSRPVTTAPQPEDIGADYALPEVQQPLPRSTAWYLVDIAALCLAMALIAVACHWWRSRRLVVGVTLASLAYFGFYRQGCVCPIGSIQNVAVALTDASYAVPGVVLAFFLLPLVAALLFGRVFCGGPCPLGAIQELVVLRSIELPAWLERPLGLLKYVYLALAVWLAIQPAPARDFIICRFDPFVGLFRLNGAAWLLITGGLLLVLGMFVGRPYCRFLCPYGALLVVFSRFAWRPVQITPDEELDCGLCAEACPFGAIKQLRADRGTCLACARCFASCPRQRAQWGEIEPADACSAVASSTVTAASAATGVPTP